MSFNTNNRSVDQRPPSLDETSSQAYTNQKGVQPQDSSNYPVSAPDDREDQPITEFGELIQKSLASRPASPEAGGEDHRAFITEPLPVHTVGMDQQGMHISVEVITPGIARKLLETNQRNRPLTRQHVLFLAEQMIKGTWQLAGDPIRISESDSLLDGQHRLSAIVHSQKAQTMVVIRNLPERTFKVMDTGRVRKASDVVAIEGYANSKYTAAVARMIINYERGNFSTTLQNMGRKPGLAVTNTDVIEFLAGHELQSYVLQGKRWYTECRLFTASEYMFFHYIFQQISPRDALSFLSSFASGADLSKNNPIYVLRKKIDSYRSNRVSVSGTEKLAYVIKAWNLFRAQKDCGTIFWNRDKESFPLPV